MESDELAEEIAVTHAVTVAYWAHLYLIVSTVLGTAGTTNPIWGELRVIPGVLVATALWGLLQGTMQ
jgi:hypothetical protein